MTQLPAGWYPDLHNPGEERLWDGIGWTDLRRPAEEPSRRGVLIGFATMILALALVSFGATALSGSGSGSGSGTDTEVAGKVSSSPSRSLLAFVDVPDDVGISSTTTEPPRSGSGAGGRGGFIEATTTTVVLNDLDHQNIAAFRIMVDGVMADVGNIGDRTIYNLGTGLCEVAKDVESDAGFATMTGLIWVGLEIDSRATYYNNSDNFLESSTAAISVFCPALTPTSRP